MAALPDRRNDVIGRDADGHQVRLSHSIAQKLYRCPGCHGDIPIGEEHVLVLTPEATDGFTHHHWHTRCAEELLVPTLAKPRVDRR